MTAAKHGTKKALATAKSKIAAEVKEVVRPMQLTFCEIAQNIVTNAVSRIKRAKCLGATFATSACSRTTMCLHSLLSVAVFLLHRRFVPIR